MRWKAASAAPQFDVLLNCGNGIFAQRNAWGSSVDALSLFGLLAVTAMLVAYALEDRSHWFIIAFAGACALGSVYGFLQGAWPFGLVEAIWAGVALRRWYVRQR